MGHIIPKLNLNKTPQAVDSNSLVFAKNIKVNQDGSLGRDNAIDLIKDLAELGTRPIVGGTQVSEYLGHIVGINACIYFFIRRTTEQNNVATIEDIVYEYNELTDDFIVIPCNWNWSGGKITGCVTTNNTNQRILTVSEYDCDALVPLKHINLSECKSSDDESIYTQNPNIPIINLHFAGYYSCTIPNGVYQFFVRYKVRDGFYTNWFPASKELYAGVAEQIRTVQGNLRYVDVEKDCSRSFIFEVEHLLPRNNKNFEEFQVGFIVSSGNATVGRMWKSFSLATSYIYFDYDKQFIEEALIDDFLRVPYEIYNVKNVINYKNKIYISNYIESSINDEMLSTYNDEASISLRYEFITTQITQNRSILSDCILTKSGDYYTSISINSSSHPIADIYTNTNFVQYKYIFNSSGRYGNGITKYDRNDEIPVPNEFPGFDDASQNLLISIYANYYNIDVYKNYVISVIVKDIYGNLHTIYNTTNLLNKLETLRNIDKDNYEAVESAHRDVFSILQNIDSRAKYQKDNKDDFITQVSNNFIKDDIIAIHSSFDKFVLQVNNNDIVIDKIYVNYLHFEFGLFSYVKSFVPIDGLHEFNIHDIGFLADVSTQIYNIVPKHISFEDRLFHNSIQQIDTLMPFTKYNFYIHYVKENGIVTNGYYIGSKEHNLINSDLSSAPIRLVPIFSNINIPTGYVAYFISIAKVENNIVQVLPTYIKYVKVLTEPELWDTTYTNYYIFVNGEYVKIPNQETVPDFDNQDVYSIEKNYTASSIELDALLYNKDGWEILQLSNNINSDFPVVVDSVKYYGSNSVSDGSFNNDFFGNSGLVVSNNTDNFSFIKSTFDVNMENLQLTKLTPYFLAKDIQDNFVIGDAKNDLNGPAYIALVTKLDPSVCYRIFCSGYDVFKINRQTLSIEEKTTTETLKDTILKVNGEIVNSTYIYSNFNLNCLTLRENLNRGIRSYNKKTETTTDDDVTTTVESLEQDYIVSVNSQNCSLIYDLPLMYREYTRKYYSVVDDKTFTVFDNTVRSSNVDVDEVFRSIYKFDAEDYYNVPTNRGIIVNLFSINNEIFVHTEHGLFKFTDSSLLKVGDNLYSSNKEVGVSESSPFEIGIAEIVDSQYGHGGLQNKEHALITFNGYIFYDSLVRNIYSYDNQSGIQNITPPVRKIIDWFEPTDVTFVSDDANNRFFITLSKVIDDTKQVICLSYSFISKSFVSIHDINYTYAFNSRLNTYFIQGSNFLKVNYKDFGSYVNKYPSVLTINDEVTFNEDSVGSCIDVIINDGYEVIKYLSHIHWICSSINDYVGENPYNVAEELIAEYGGDSIRVYSDQTWSDLLPINTEQNTQPINSANSYQYPRYNNGIWTMNYFRDIKNADSNYISDEMSLIHGKYIVVRFIFGANKKNFKFENLNINFKNYEKV